MAARQAKRLAWLLGGLLMAFQPGGAPALAQDASAEDSGDTERARALFFEGVELMSQERYAEAADRFRATRELRRSGAVSFNLALALYELGQLGETANLLAEVVDDESTERRMRRQARRMLREVEPQVGQLTVHIEGDLAGVEITLDGQSIPPERLDMPMRVDPGRRTLAAQRGTRRGQRTVEVPAGESVEVSLTIPPPSAEETARAGLDDELLDREEEDDADSGGGILTEWWFWTAVGALLVGTVAAAILLAPEDPTPVQGNLDPPLLEVRP